MIDPTLGNFPQSRMRRNRTNGSVRRMVAENTLSSADFIWPVFVVDGKGVKQIIPSMPGQFRYSTDMIVDVIGSALDLGITAVAVFPHSDPTCKSDDAFEAINPENLVCRAVRNLRAAYPELVILCDVALDPYTPHGHDGLLSGDIILNDETIELLVKQALVQAKAGCDSLAPSDMMDGRIGIIRAGLDNAGFTDVRLISYAAKYASGFYGPFRDAIGSQQSLNGDKSTYQMDPANGDEALREVAKDIHEGADIVIVKPGMPYLDILTRVKDHFGMPTFAYQVSGEYAMIRSAIDKGWMDEKKVIMESLICFKRAGADAILTYFAPYAAKILKEG